MAGGRVYSGGGGGSGGSSLSVLLQSQRPPCAATGASEPLDSFFLSGSSPSFLAGSGSRSMVSFEDVRGGNKSNHGFFRPFDPEENGDEELDEYFHQPEKKRRLTPEQVQFLERNFEMENKLEPERKTQLARDLGLQPRQVAIWFQNRRARWKTKQLEKDYEALQATYTGLKSDYESLLKEKDKLKAEVLELTDKLRLKEKGSSELSQGGEKTPQEPPRKAVAGPVSECEVSKVSAVGCKQEDISPAKSDMFDSDSPHYADAVHSSLLDPADSSYPFEPEHSDLSQDEEDNPSKCFMPAAAYVFPKVEDADYTDAPANSSNFGFPVEDHAIWSWSY